MNRYPATFRTYILNGLEHWLAQVVSTEGSLAQSFSGHVFHLLNYAFKLEGAWPLVNKLILQIAPKITLASIPDEWQLCLDRAICLSESRNDLYVQGKLQLYAGYIQQRNNHLEGAKASYEKSACCFAAINDTREYAWSTSRLANVQRMMKQFTHAQLTVEKSLRMLADDDPYLVLTYMVLGWIAYDQSDWINSQNFFERALQLSRKNGDKQREAHLTRDLGSVLQMQSQFEQAIEKYHEAIPLLEIVHDEYDLALTEMNLGVVYLFLKQWQDAQTWLERAHLRFQEWHDSHSLGMTYTNLAISYRGLGQNNLAIRLFEESIALFHSLQDWYLAANSLDELGLTFQNLGELERARESFKFALNDLRTLPANTMCEQKIVEVLQNLEACR